MTLPALKTRRGLRQIGTARRSLVLHPLPWPGLGPLLSSSRLTTGDGLLGKGRRGFLYLRQTAAHAEPP